jgi:cell division protein FtsZ
LSTAVSFVGGARLSIAEVIRVMEPIHEYCGSAHMFVGASIDPDLEDQLAVTLIASKGGRLGVVMDGLAEGAAAQGTTSGSRESFDLDLGMGGATSSGSTRSANPGSSELSMEKRTEILKRQEGASDPLMRAARRLRQGLLPLEIVSRGRFEKSEPTMHRGEDLDVPTYIRRGVFLN